MKQKKPEKEANIWMVFTIILGLACVILMMNIEWKKDFERENNINIGSISIPEESLNNILVNFKVGDVVNLCDVENKQCVKIQLNGG